MSSLVKIYIILLTLFLADHYRTLGTIYMSSFCPRSVRNACIVAKWYVKDIRRRCIVG